MKIKNGVLTNVEDSDIMDGSFNIPSSVTVIGDDAFWRCENLVSIDIPSSVTAIGNDTFFGCKNLANIDIPSSVTTIGHDTFWGCESLANIDIPSSVTTIGRGAFYGCKNLADISIPSSVTTIGNNAFCECANLKEMTFADHNGQVTAYKPQYINGIPTFIQSQKTIRNGITIYKCQSFNGMENGLLNLKDCCVAESDGIFAHRTTLKDAVSGLIRELIALADGQYGSDMFKEFFDD